MNTSVRVTTNRDSLRLGVILLMFCLVCASFAWAASQHTASIGFLVVSIVGIYLCSTFGVLTMNTDSVVERTIIGKRTAQWREVTKIEIIDQGQFLRFVSSQHRITMNGPSVWYGGEREKMIKFLETQAKQHNIDY